MRPLLSLLAATAFISGTLCAAEPNQLSNEENAQGFKLLFDGQSLEGWKHNGNWEVADGAMACPRRKGDITYQTAKVPDDFELRFEWKASKGCNSGVYYRPTQYEYQVLDNANSPYGENPRQSAAALYFCMAPSKDVVRPHDEWNDARIVCKGTVIQHWLNGEKVVDFDYADPRWKEEVGRLAARGGDLTQRGSHLRLQDHGQAVWYRSLRMREIPAEEELTAAPDFKPMPIPEAALLKENQRIQQMNEARQKKAKKAS